MNRIRIRRQDKFLQTPLHPFVCASSANGNPVHHLIFQIVFKHFVPACDRSPGKGHISVSFLPEVIPVTTFYDIFPSCLEAQSRFHLSLRDGNVKMYQLLFPNKDSRRHMEPIAQCFDLSNIQFSFSV